MAFRHRKRWVVGWVAVAALALVGGPYVYIHFIEGPAPAPLTLGSASPSSGSEASDGDDPAADPAGTDGTWSVGDGSVVGYRVKETIFGQSNVAVGRTGEVDGTMTVDGTVITGAEFTVDMTAVTSDESRRDDQFNGRIMETSTYPTATFTLRKPIDFGAVPDAGAKRSFEVTGDLTMHGVTRSVTFRATGRSTGSRVEVAGSIPVVFADWDIANPRFGPVSTDDHGVLEFALEFDHA